MEKIIKHDYYQSWPENRSQSWLLSILARKLLTDMNIINIGKKTAHKNDYYHSWPKRLPNMAIIIFGPKTAH